MDILKLVLENQEYMVAQRRYLHENAEVSAKEIETIAHLDEELTAMGIDHVVVENGGILGFIEGAKPGKTVLLRADVDALPMQEDVNNLKGSKPSVSKNEGVCHACGHDGHAAMLLTAGKILNQHRDEIEGRVILMFERGEEGSGNVVYLYKYIEDHQIPIDSSYGIHLYAMMESGTISLNGGPVMACPYGASVTIHGRGGHGSRPDQSISPIDCFVACYNALTDYRMKYVSPFETLTLSVGTVHAGSAGNIIPETLTFRCGIRTLSQEVGEEFIARVPKMMENIAAAYDCTVDCVCSGGLLPTVNDPVCAELARKVVGEAIGAQRVQSVEPWMASESMAFTMKMWPGVLAFVGIANEEKGTGAPHHNGAFDIDEDALAYGAASAVAYALGFLRSDIDTSDRRYPGSAYELVKALPIAKAAYNK